MTEAEKSAPKRSELKAELRQMRRKSAKPLLYISMVSMVMLFAALTSAYIVRAGNGDWLIFELPPVSILSTAVIIASSLTMIAAVYAIKRDNYLMTNVSLFLTFALGITFFFTQIEGWRQLTAQNVYFMGSRSNASGNFLYLIALVHLLHMVGGLIALLVSLTKSLLKRYSSTDYLGLELTGIFWHFLDLLWVYLFLFLYNYR